MGELDQQQGVEEGEAGIWGGKQRNGKKEEPTRSTRNNLYLSKQEEEI